MLLISQVKRLILDKYPKIQDPSRRQLLWLVQELVRLKVADDVDSLCAALMRQIIGGDLSPKNIGLASSILKLLLDNK